MGGLTITAGARRALIAALAVLLVGADATAIAVTDAVRAAAARPSASVVRAPSAPRDRTAAVAIEPRTVAPVRYAWIRPAVVDVWEKTTSPRRVDRITMTANPDMRTWVHRLTLALRLDLNGRLMTQGLHGDRVAVLRTARGWSLIRLESQTGGAFPHGIIGYLPTVQLSHTSFAHAPAGRHSVATVVGAARQYLGVSYLWAGMSGYGIDCSGLTYRAFRAAGVTLPRDAADQAKLGLPVGWRHLQRGDLVFFGRGARTNIHHVGIYLGGGLMLHAPHTGSHVRVSPLSAFSDYWGARRIIR